MTWIYVLGVAAIIVLWVICLAIGDLHKMVGEQLFQMYNALQGSQHERGYLRSLAESVGSNDKQLYTVVEELSGIATTLEHISARVYDLQEPGRNILAIREAARSIRESAVENYGAQQEDTRIMYAGIASKLEDIARDISAAMSGSQRR